LQHADRELSEAQAHTLASQVLAIYQALDAQGPGRLDGYEGDFEATRVRLEAAVTILRWRRY
jgi:hypothetical protein